MLGQVGRGDFPGQGARTMVVEVGLHAGMVGPTSGQRSIGAGTAHHRAENTGIVSVRAAPPWGGRARTPGFWARVRGLSIANPSRGPTRPVLQARLAAPLAALCFEEAASPPAQAGAREVTLPRANTCRGGRRWRLLCAPSQIEEGRQVAA